MLYAYAIIFDVMFWGENFWELNTPSVKIVYHNVCGENADEQGRI
jgi:hypothetical protein